ncbi:YecA family protein [Bacillus sp. THAF10]|uniref:YecA family protein n=1 Tax=Bacillus sp. THAF10 TaxID=2587848 RepID=UPI001C12BE89|nr:SEC-C metal-binding domain-containing protein [Bacillus sp. THAF10]
MEKLHSIRRKWDIGNASKLKKAELVNLLAKEVPENLPVLVKKWDDKRFDLLVKLAKNNGKMTTKVTDVAASFYLKDSGIIFPIYEKEKKMLVLPIEFVEKVKELESDNEIRKVIKRNTEWIKIVKGLLFYYGALESGTLFDFMIERYELDLSELRAFLDVVHEGEMFYDEYEIRDGYFAEVSASDPAEVLKEHAIRANVPYFPFSKKELIRAGSSDDYVDRTSQYLKLVSFLQKNGSLSKGDAEDIVAEISWSYRFGDDFNSGLHMIANEIIFEKESDIRNLLDDFLLPFYHSTKQWSLKGHSPDELSSSNDKKAARTPVNNVVSFESRQKVGRNDPCPCGSGKKFKKCCGD